jgi:hypothetical protein
MPFGNFLFQKSELLSGITLFSNNQPFLFFETHPILVHFLSYSDVRGISLVMLASMDVYKRLP